jgi:hypothetical protein
MTMQIVMVGTDGIVLASDTRWMNNNSGVRHTSSASKIKVSHKKGVAIACARSLELASRIADDLIDELDDQGWLLFDQAAIPIAERAISAVKSRRDDFQCLIVTTKPIRRAFHLCFGIYAQQKHVTCQQVSNSQVAGDNVNAAVFWSERYYWRSSLRHEVQQLVPLAAQVICSAGELSKDNISGLEIVVCNGKNSGPQRLSDDVIKHLQAQSHEWGTRIESFFADYTYNFTFAPKEAG